MDNSVYSRLEIKRKKHGKSGERGNLLLLLFPKREQSENQTN